LALTAVENGLEMAISRPREFKKRMRSIEKIDSRFARAD